MDNYDQSYSGDRRIFHLRRKEDKRKLFYFLLAVLIWILFTVGLFYVLPA